MLNIHPDIKVNLACGVTDLRKSVDGLSVMIQEHYQLDPFSSELFVFCNRDRNKLKILHWEDGYAGYNKAGGIIRVGCFAHVRRYFMETLDSLPPKQKAKSEAQMGVKFCNDLFEMDRRLTTMPEEKKHDFREKRVAELLASFYNWLKKMEPEVLPKSKFVEAITYCLKQWQYLKNIVVDDRIEVSNNLAERSIKPFVIGRKNWLFSNTPKGAKSSAIIYSLVETAKENGLIPYAYLKFLLEQLPNMEITPETLAYLMPWSPYIPVECRLKKKK